MAALRFFMLLALVVWIGGVIFLAFVTAPSAFAVVPSRQLAGAVVGRTLGALHWMGIISGVVFAVCSMAYSAFTTGSAEPFAGRHLIVYLMIIITLVSQFGITPKMVQLRAEMVEVDRLPQDDARRVQFNRLHKASERLEGGVLILGLVLLFLTARRLS